MDVGNITLMRVRTDFNPKGTMFGCDLDADLFKGIVECKVSYGEKIGAVCCFPQNEEFGDIGDPRVVAMFLKAYHEGQRGGLKVMEQEEAISYLRHHLVSEEIYWMATDKVPPRDGKPLFNSTPVIFLEA